MTETTEFVDAQQMHRDHPKTFDAPSEQELAKIDVGTFVKICAGKERFWAEVVKVEGDKVNALVGNDLVYTDEHGLSLGDYITFEKRNIYSFFER